MPLDRSDVLIVGAGPQGLACALHLLFASPGLTIKVVDPTGRWLAAWDHRFAAFEIPHLRSPHVHHPAVEAEALATFGSHAAAFTRGRYALPATGVFHDFCLGCAAQAGLSDGVIPGRVLRVDPDPGGIAVQVDGDAGATTILASNVVVATNPRRPRIPAWAVEACDSTQVRHSSDIDLRTADVGGKAVLVVGGGLTAADLVVGAAERGARVVMVVRRRLRPRMFDVDPGWLGPKCLRGFAEESDPHVRFCMVLQARDGGRVTPSMLARLRALARDRTIEILEETDIVAAGRCAGRWMTTTTRGDALGCDEIWLATGSKSTVEAEPILAQLQERHPTELVDGLPVLDAWLRWPSTKIHVAGALASLTLGPAAGNLWGARQAALRVTEAVCGTRLEVLDADFLGGTWRSSEASASQRSA
jgi:cation diffusion facilitator CzcD-associated flavoprotein CzcO